MPILHFFILSFCWLTSLTAQDYTKSLTDPEIRLNHHTIYGNPTWYLKTIDENTKPGPHLSQTPFIDVMKYFNTGMKKALKEGNFLRAQKLSETAFLYLCGETPTPVREKNSHKESSGGSSHKMERGGPTRAERNEVIESTFLIAKIAALTAAGPNRSRMTPEELLLYQTPEAFFQSLTEKYFLILPEDKRLTPQSTYLLFSTLNAYMLLNGSFQDIDWDHVKGQAYNLLFNIHMTAIEQLKMDERSVQPLLQFTGPYFGWDSILFDVHIDSLNKATDAMRRLSPEFLEHVSKEIAKDFDSKKQDTFYEGNGKRYLKDIVNDTFFLWEPTSGNRNYCFFNALRQKKANQSYDAHIDFPNRIGKLSGEHRELAKKIIGASFIQKLSFKQPSKSVKTYMGYEHYADQLSTFNASEKIRRQFEHSPLFQNLETALLLRTILKDRNAFDNGQDQTYGDKNITLQGIFEWVKENPDGDVNSMPIRIKVNAHPTQDYIQDSDVTKELRKHSDTIRYAYRPIANKLQKILKSQEKSDENSHDQQNIIDKLDDLTKPAPGDSLDEMKLAYNETYTKFENYLNRNLSNFLDGTEVIQSSDEESGDRTINYLEEAARAELESANMQNVPSFNNLAGLFAIMDETNVITFNSQGLNPEVKMFIVDPAWKTTYTHLSSNHYTRLRPLSGMAH